MLHVGLRAIAKRVGVTVWLVQRMADSLGLPLMFHPKTVLKGKRIVWCLDEEMFLRWCLAQSRLNVQAYRIQLAERHIKLVDQGRGIPWSEPAQPAGTSIKTPAKGSPT